jgi:hypothetical protein
MAGLWVSVVPVVAAQRESDCTMAESTGLALETSELPVGLQDQIAARLLAERDI